jgi:hypothetical protein
MVDLDFACTGVGYDRYGAAPTLMFGLRVTAGAGVRVHAVALRCQIRLEVARRDYSAHEAALLGDIFGDRSRWQDTLRGLHLAHTSVMVPSFTGETDLRLPVPVSYDLEVATGKYLHALTDGGVPLTLMFAGTVFGRSDHGFWVEQVPWHKEATATLPVPVWRELMDTYFPDSGWLRLRRDVLDDLARFKSSGGFATWDEAMASLVALRPSTGVAG